MRRILIVVIASLALASCDVEGGKGTAYSVFVPAAAFGVAISPSVLVINPVTTTSCAFVPAFDTNFNLFLSAGNVSFSMQSVTLTLGDGSNVGGPSVTIPQPELQRLFPSLIVTDQSIFAFNQRFGCGVIQPRTLTAEVIGVEKSGTTRRLTATATFR